MFIYKIGAAYRVPRIANDILPPNMSLAIIASISGT